MAELAPAVALAEAGQLLMISESAGPIQEGVTSREKHLRSIKSRDVSQGSKI